MVLLKMMSQVWTNTGKKIKKFLDGTFWGCNTVLISSVNIWQPLSNNNNSHKNLQPIKYEAWGFNHCNGSCSSSRSVVEGAYILSGQACEFGLLGLVGVLQAILKIPGY